MNDKKRENQVSTLLWYRLSRVQKENLMGANELLKKYNITYAQTDVIIRIGEHEELTQNELAEKLLVTKGNVTQLLKKLEEKQLVQKRKDWKINYVSLTEEGSALYKKLIQDLEEYQNNFFSALNYEEKRTLLRLLTKIDKSNTSRND